MSSGVTRGCGGRTAPGDTLQGVTPEGKNFLWANLQRIVEKRGRTSKKVWGDTRVKAIKSDISDEQKRSSVFAKKKSGVTPQNWRLKKVARFFRKT